MSKRTGLLIALLSIITVLLLYFAVTENNRVQEIKTNNPQVLKIKEKPINISSEIYSSPSAVTVNPLISSNGSVDIYITTGTNKISGVQLEMSFDPKVVSNIKLTQPVADPFFKEDESITLVDPAKVVDYKNGRISYIIAITPNQTPKTGTGKIASLSFTATPELNQTQTQISFLNKTMVTELDTLPSVLKKTTPIIINFVK